LISIRTNPGNFTELGVTLGQIQNALNTHAAGGMYLSSLQTLVIGAAAWTKINLTMAATGSSMGMVTVPASQQVVVPSAGLYLLWISGAVACATAPEAASIGVARNHTVLEYQVTGRVALTDVGRRTLSALGLVTLAAKDVLEPYAYSDGGGDLSFYYLQFGALRVG